MLTSQQVYLERKGNHERSWNKRKQTRSFRLEPLEDRSLLSALLPDVQSARDAFVSVSSNHPGGVNVLYMDGSVGYAALKSFHPGGANFSMADGSVRFIKSMADGSVKFIKDSLHIGVYQSLGSRNGGEVISSDSMGPNAGIKNV